MGRLIREIMEDQKEQFHVAPPEMIPELLLLGTLEKRELSLMSGEIILMDIVEYNNKNYAVRISHGGKWIGTRDDLDIKCDEVYDTIHW